MEPSLYEFGPFTVQPDERLLLREGRPVSLTPKAFDLLIQLVERPGQLVGKQELMTALWPDTFVEETNLAYTMSALRRALGDGQNGNQYIQTVPTRGYRFVSQVVGKEPAVSMTADRIPRSIARGRGRFPAIAVAAVAIAGLGGLLLGSWAPWRDAASTAPMQVSIELGVQATLPTTDAAFAVSADGTLLAFAARENEGEPRLYVRRLDQLTATPIPGTEGASSPFFSPHGQWVAFFADLHVKKVPVTGGAVQTLAEAPNPRGGCSAQLAASEAGTLAYLPGENLFDVRPIAWMDRQGTVTSLRAVPAHWSNPEFSPDGHRIAMDIRTNGQTDIFVYEWARGTLIKLTSESGNEEYPVWTRDGKRIAYRSFNPSSNPPYTLSWKPADGSGKAQILTQSTGTLRPGSWHPTQNVLVFVAERPDTGPDVMLLRLEGDDRSGWKPGQPTAFLDSAARELNPVFSHDGKWLAYRFQRIGPGGGWLAGCVHPAISGARRKDDGLERGRREPVLVALEF